MAKTKKQNGKGKTRGRRSKAEAMTGAKENQVEVRTAGIGDNSQLPLPAPNDYQHHMKTIKGAMDKVETAKSLLSHAKEAANKCCDGLAANIKETISIERENDPIKLRKRFEMLGIGLSQIGSTIQLSVFATLAGDVTEQAYKRGFADGEAGRTANGGYPENSDLDKDYGRGWRHGTAKNLGMTPEESDAALQDEDGDKSPPNRFHPSTPGAGRADRH